MRVVDICEMSGKGSERHPEEYVRHIFPSEIQRESIVFSLDSASQEYQLMVRVR
jgi:hypothetical protein